MDGKKSVFLDLTAEKVRIFLNDGSGNLSELESSFDFPLANPVDVAVADFDGDGFQDLAIAYFAQAEPLFTMAMGQETLQIVMNFLPMD